MVRKRTFSFLHTSQPIAAASLRNTMCFSYRLFTCTAFLIGGAESIDFFLPLFSGWVRVGSWNVQYERVKTSGLRKATKPIGQDINRTSWKDVIAQEEMRTWDAFFIANCPVQEKPCHVDTNYLMYTHACVHTDTPWPTLTPYHKEKDKFFILLKKLPPPTHALFHSPPSPRPIETDQETDQPTRVKTPVSKTTTYHVHFHTTNKKTHLIGTCKKIPNCPVRTPPNTTVTLLIHVDVKKKENKWIGCGSLPISLCYFFTP